VKTTSIRSANIPTFVVPRIRGRNSAIVASLQPDQDYATVCQGLAASIRDTPNLQVVSPRKLRSKNPRLSCCRIIMSHPIAYLVLEIDWNASRQRQLNASQVSAETRVMKCRPTVMIRYVYISLVLVNINHRHQEY